MVNFTIDQVREAMNNRSNIRNMSVIAHVDHGKTTLTDSLIRKAGIISESQCGDRLFTQTREDEKNRGITIKSTGVSLHYEQAGQNYLINLIDCPGHVDFSSEVTAALRVTDGALVVVDYIEGVCVQTETVFRQALQELIKPVLFINKVDRAFFEVKHDPELIYQNFNRTIENANVIISTYQKCDTMGDLQVNPVEGTVAFGSAYHGWGFTLNTFAEKIGKKFGIDPLKILPKLWGDNYYNPINKKWTNISNTNEGIELSRGFCSHVLEPIIKLANAIQDEKKEVYLELIHKLGINISTEELSSIKGTRFIMKKIMHSWIDLADALLEMVTLHLPSPKTAQKYRTPYLYQGPQDDEVALAMQECDPNGPVMMFVSKMVPNKKDPSRFFAFGRVFSGTIKTGKKVRILGPGYIPGKSNDLYEKNIMKVVIWMANKIEEVESIPCGNTCALVGVDQYILKQATITDYNYAHTIKSMKYSVAPVVRIAVSPKNPFDLPKLLEGLKKMAQSDPLVQLTTTETEQIVAGCGELHLEMCLKDLREEYTNNIEINVSDPVVPYKETVTEKSNQVCLVKSSNKHNRLMMTAEPLGEELVLDIEKGTTKENLKLVDKYSWDSHDAKKLWCFGIEGCTPNAIVDQSQGVQYLNEIKDAIESSFNWVIKDGVLAEENMRGIRFNIIDSVIHRDPAHRGGGQIIPAAKRCFYAAELTAKPRFQEPVYMVDISTPNDTINTIYQIFSQKRGVIYSEEAVVGTPLLNIKAYLPVSESFGFTQYLRSQTSGQASPQCVFDHWEIINEDPLDSKSKAYKLLMDIRKRKGLKLEALNINEYIDKI